MKTVNLHIGPRKTGTTTIQRALFDNKELLLQNNILVPTIGRAYPNSAAHHNLVWALMNSNHYRKNLGDWDDLTQHLEICNENNIILSSEVFSSLIIDKIHSIKEQ